MHICTTLLPVKKVTGIVMSISYHKLFMFVQGVFYCVDEIIFLTTNLIHIALRNPDRDKYIMKLPRSPRKEAPFKIGFEGDKASWMGRGTL